MTRTPRVVLVGLAVGVVVGPLSLNVVRANDHAAPRPSAVAAQTSAPWALDLGAPLFTAAGRDWGPQPKYRAPGPATDRAGGADGVLALPGDAFVIVDVSDGRWLRVDARGQMSRLLGSRQLAENPEAVAAAPDGSVLVREEDNGIVRLAPDGQLTTVLNAQTANDLGAVGLAVQPDGGILAAGGAQNRVSLIRDGATRTVAGTGTDGRPSGDGGPATAAVVPDPRSVSAFADGSFLIAGGD